MKILRYFLPILLSLLAGLIGYYLGKQNSSKILQHESAWQQMDAADISFFLPFVLKYTSWENLSKEEARATLSKHIDAARVPHGDLSISSQNIHSKRYIISQWQRVATGAAIIVLGHDKENELCVALGGQRGKIVQPQGYMESYLPHEDLTGLRALGASRINGSTNTLITADNTLEDTAQREIKEEIGIDIQQKDLKLLNVSSDKNTNPILHTIAVHYVVMLQNTPELNITDTEFVKDDLQKPRWVKIKSITCNDDNCYIPNNKLPMHHETITELQRAIKKFATDSEKEKAVQVLNFHK